MPGLFLSINIYKSLIKSVHFIKVDYVVQSERQTNVNCEPINNVNGKCDKIFISTKKSVKIQISSK
jgi:hypothetical protein